MCKNTYVKRERVGEDMMWYVLWGEDADAFSMGRWGIVDLVCFFWRYYNLIYRIGVGNTCGDRIGSFLARLNSPLRLLLCISALFKEVCEAK